MSAVHDLATIRRVLDLMGEPPSPEGAQAATMADKWLTTEDRARFVAVAARWREQVASKPAPAEHSCPACPTEVRDLSACAHNLLVWLDAGNWERVAKKKEGLRASLARLKPIMDAHFAAQKPSLLTPQPAPTPATGDLWAEVIADGEGHYGPELLADMAARREHVSGLYGSLLSHRNQVNARTDAYLAALDGVAAAYGRARQLAEAGDEAGAETWMDISYSAGDLAERIRKAP